MVSGFNRTTKKAAETRRQGERFDSGSEPDADPDEFEAGHFEEEISLDDWQELARLVPDLLLEEEPANLLGRRDIDVNYDWSPHVDRYRHPSFPSGEYWEDLREVV
jgi:hypothetical protein